MLEFLFKVETGSEKPRNSSHVDNQNIYSATPLAGLERCVKALEDASDLQAAAANCDTETKEAEDLGDMQGLLEATLAELKTAQVELEQERCKSAAAATAAVLREKQDAEMLESTQDEVRFGALSYFCT